MLVRAVLFSAALLAGSSAVPVAGSLTIAAAAAPPPLPANVSVVSGGYAWVENLCFDGASSSCLLRVSACTAAAVASQY